MPNELRQMDDEGNCRCTFCGEFKPIEEFAIKSGYRDSYCVLCRQQYQHQYHRRRAMEDPLYLLQKAARLRHRYRKDPAARARRLDSSIRYKARKAELAKEAEKYAIAEGIPIVAPEDKRVELPEPSVLLVHAERPIPEPAEQAHADKMAERAAKEAKEREIKKRWEDV